LQKFKLELEADHAGITSKLEQVVSSKNEGAGGNGNGNPSATGSNTLNSLNLNFNGTGDDSDFTLCPSSTSDLMMILMSNSVSSAAATGLHTPGNNDISIVNATTGSAMTSGSHKRKHSTFSDKNSTSSTVNLLNSLVSKDDEDSSSSWASTSHPSIFGMPGSTKKSTSFKKSNIPMGRQDSSLLGLVQPGGSSIPGGSSSSNNSRRPSTSRPLGGTGSLKRSRDRIKNRARLNDYDYDDESSSNLAEEFYQSDETGDETNEGGASESGRMGAPGLRHYDEDMITSDDDNLDDDFDQFGSATNMSNKFKLGKHNRRNNKDDAGSGDDNNEKYCICKDVSYGEMIMCDNTRVSTCFSSNSSSFIIKQSP
jgi:hypothetical protein